MLVGNGIVVDIRHSFQMRIIVFQSLMKNISLMILLDVLWNLLKLSMGQIP